MSAERNVTVAVPWMHSKNVANFIRLHVVEANLAEPISQPRGAMLPMGSFTNGLGASGVRLLT